MLSFRLRYGAIIVLWLVSGNAAFSASLAVNAKDPGVVSPRPPLGPVNRYAK